MLKAGFARLDVTPPLGTHLAGYFNDRRADGILDPIELNALAFSDEEQTNVIIVADFLGIMEEFATPIRQKIAAETGLAEDHILLASIHAHTSIRLGCAPWKFSVDDDAYLDVLYRKFVDAARLAVADLQEAELTTAQAPTAQPISFIRRFRMKDGSTKTNPGCRNPEIAHPIGEADNTVRLVRFRRKTGGDIALVNFSTHPDVIGGTKMSADWPGFVRRDVEADHPGAHCVFLNGAQGDTNHVDTSLERSNGGYAHSAFMGRTVADAVRTIWDGGEPHAGRVFSEFTMVMTPSNREGAEKKEYYAQMLRDYYENGVKYSSTELGRARRVATLDTMPLQLKLPVTVMGVGDVVIVGFGGEPFTAYASHVRETAKDAFLLAACCANGQQGYLPNPDAFAEGGYEASSSRFTPQMPSDVLNAADALLKKNLNN